MKKILFLLIVGVAVFAAAGGTARADGPDAAMNVQGVGAFVYNFSTLQYQQVPDLATGWSVGLVSAGDVWANVQTVASTDDLATGEIGAGNFAAPIGTPLPSVWDAPPPAFAELGDGSLYAYGTDGAYHYVPGPDAAFAAGLTWNGTDWAGVTYYDTVSDLPAAVGADLGS